MKNIFSTIFLCVIYAFCFAQKTNSYYRSIEYFDKTDSSKNYAIFFRPNGPAQKLLLLIPEFGESPQLAEIETDIPEVAAANGILTVIISNNEGNLSFQLDGNAQQYLDSIIPLLLFRNNIPNGAYYIGGFSFGGAAAIKYVQHCAIYDIPYKPKAIFTIDPPLDFVRLYKAYDNWVKDTAKYAANKTFYKLLLSKMQTYFKGDINDVLENYIRLSPYCYDDKNKYGVRLFGTTPILTFCEPDFLWAIYEKHWNAYDLNIIDIVGFYNDLNNNGNKDAKLILTQNKGFRKVLKYKHPHSWSIANPNETVKWLLKH